MDLGFGEYDPFPSEVIEVNTTVKHIIIEEGITGIDNCFNDLHNLETISLPDSLERIHDSFVDCDKIAKFLSLSAAQDSSLTLKNDARNLCYLQTHASSSRE